jgi:exodeoxyribonuclease V alpha subunit
MTSNQPVPSHPIFLALRHCYGMGHSVMTMETGARIKRRQQLRYDANSVQRYIKTGKLVILEGRGLERGLTSVDIARQAARVALQLDGAGPKPMPGSAPNDDLTASQKAAWKLLCGAGWGLLTGGPGTGKTYLVSKMVKMLHHRSKRVSICAPTGKAASVLSLKLGGATVTTIHRMLGLRPGTLPQHDHRNPIFADYIFVDESSMIDEQLMAYLLDAVDLEKTGIIFSGDPNQLPPVGSGAPFCSMLKSRSIPHAHLVEIVRQQEGNGIIKLARDIQEGKFRIPSTNVTHYPCRTDAVEGKAIRFFCDNGTRSRWEIEKPSDLMILSATKQKKFDGSTSRINKAVSHKLHPDRTIPHCKFTPGDRMMFTVNDYEHGFVNGELGTLLMYDKKDKHASIRNDNGKMYDLRSWKIGTHAEWAYALTIHKAQGSESKVIVLVVTNAAPHMHTRELIYTAVTRAREELVIIGDLRVLEKAVRKTINRVSALDYFLGRPEYAMEFADKKSSQSLKGVMDYG